MKCIAVVICVFLYYNNCFASEGQTERNDLKEVSVKNETEFINSYDGRIVNGTKARFGQFPHHVSLRRNFNLLHFCGGSLITPKVVLTAAHCLFINKQIVILPWTVVVVAGELTISPHEIDPNHKREVSKFSLHEHFKIKTYENDIALLHLTEPFKFDFSFYNIPLPSNPIKAGTFCQVAGWGQTSYNGNVSDDLLFVELPIVSRSKCKRIWPDLFEGQFCSGYLKGEKDACLGDSGGGLVCLGELVGVVSTGKGCAWRMLPGLYTDVYYYKDWVLDHLNEFDYDYDYDLSYNDSDPNSYNNSYENKHGRKIAKDSSSGSNASRFSIMCTFLILLCYFAI